MRVPNVLSPANRLRAGIVLAVLAIAWASPHQALSCPFYVDSYTYFNGCGSSPSITGDDWEECNGATGGWGSAGHWRVRLRQDCIQAGSWCADISNNLTYWENCSGSWVQRTQTQFENGSCQC